MSADQHLDFMRAAISKAAGSNDNSQCSGSHVVFHGPVTVNVFVGAATQLPPVPTPSGVAAVADTIWRLAHRIPGHLKAEDLL